MQNSIEILNELQELSPLLAAMDKVHVWEVPSGYFDNLPAVVWAAVNEEKNSLPQPQRSFTVPQNYFDDLPNAIMNKIKSAENFSAELTALSPVIAHIQRNNIFYVPDGYFEQLPQIILQKVKPAAKVVWMQRSKTMLKYAVAAVVTGVIALGIYKYAGTDKTAPAESASATPLEPSIEKGKRMNEQQFTAALNNLSEEEISQYLVQNGNEADVALLTSTIDENSLPSEEDYLLDEKTLDHYLHDIETNSNNN